MADLIDGLARHLDAAGLATYVPDGVGGDLMLEHMPQAPEECVVLTGYGGPEADSRLGYDEPSVQVRVRGGQDPRISRDRCAAIRSELHGLGPVTLPGGVRLISCIAVQASPASMGVDALGRHEHVCNFRAEIRSVTTHRV